MEEALYAFTILNLADITTTIAALKSGGYEANPIARWFLKRMGYPGLFFLKYISMAFVILAGYLQGNLETSIWVSNMILATIVMWNSYVNFSLSIKRGGNR